MSGPTKTSSKISGGTLADGRRKIDGEPGAVGGMNRLGILGCPRVKESPPGRRKGGGGDSLLEGEGGCGEGGKSEERIWFLSSRREKEKGRGCTRNWCEQKFGEEKLCRWYKMG